jgi:hypothetical protein
MSRPQRVRISIDRLVLHGVDRADAAAVRRAMVAALTSHLGSVDTSTVAPPAGHDRVRLTVGSTNGASGLGQSAGEAVAGAVGFGARGRR